ncbi:MAG: class I SAM-dependent methyltransferase [Rhizomicrobium sp.]
MTTVFKLFAKVLQRQLPPKILIYSALNKTNYLLKTGNRRFEFERLYLEDADLWNFRSSSYEQRKCELTIARVLSWRRGSKNAFEVGCSVGAFTKTLASHFKRATALDVSREALRAASDYNRSEKNVDFVHGDFRSLHIDGRYDVIFCAEILYYILEKDVQKVCRQLDRYLTSNGIIILVNGIAKGPPNFFYFSGWEEALSKYFYRLSKEVIHDSSRPYKIVIFER